MSSIAIATAKATRALRRFERAGPKTSAGPTPERLVKAAGLAQVGVACDAEGSAAAGIVRVRVTASPLEIMAQRRRLDADPMMAQAMLSAGRRYLGDWTKAGLSTLKGRDPAKIRTTVRHGGLLVGPDDLEGQERVSIAFAEYRAASEAMHVDARRAVDAIVLHEMAMVDAGARVDPMTKDRATRIALATYELRKGLRTLAVHFGLIEVAPKEPSGDRLEADMPSEVVGLLAAMVPREAQSA